MSLRFTPERVLQQLQPLYGPCVLCEVRCGAMREDDERGECGLGRDVHIYNRLLHMGEEAPLVPSYAIFTSGCNLMCSFCSEWMHLTPPFKPAPADPEKLARKTVRALERASKRVSLVRNINFVGGEPGIILPFIARFAQALEPLLPDHPPLLLNSNGYLHPKALALATHLCPIFVLDLKFGHDDCAEKIGGVSEYWSVLTRNLSLLQRAAESEPGAVVVDGVPVLPVELWVRHLLMPEHLACCTAPALDWLASNAASAHVNVMPAFVPFRGEGNDPWSELSDEERQEGRTLLERSSIARPFYDGRPLERGQ